ncbi:hypothetical protein ACTXT7_008621 [Hymenolepis weldensis]
MLSAAVDIINMNHPKDLSTDLKFQGRVNCTEMGTGAILLADIGPSLILKSVFLCALFALSSVVCASISCGLGDVTFLTMVAFFETCYNDDVTNKHRKFNVPARQMQDVVSAWSSGTGAAGVVGALSYAAMTSIWLPEVVLRIIILVPLALLFVYFVVLKKPRSPVFQLTSSLIIRETQVNHYPDSPVSGVTVRGVLNGSPTNEEGADSPSSRRPLLRNDDRSTIQISPSREAAKRIFMEIFPLIFALALVYFFEYLINQALFELVYFENVGLTQAEQYRWQVVNFFR